jgi:hypothetical protein
MGWLVSCLVLSCSNSPYPPEDPSKQILYTSFVEAPRTLDPATAYTTSAHAVTGSVYDTPEASPRVDAGVGGRAAGEDRAS